MAELQSPLLRIPGEIRLMIYDLLFNDYGQKVFEIRNEDPDIYSRRGLHARTMYRVQGRDLVRQNKPTTYRLINDVDIHTSIMSVNRTIYEEAVYALYAFRSFSFGMSFSKH